MIKSFVIKDDNVEQYATTIANWIADRVKSANRKGVVLGMSGGIDSSVVACLCHLAKVDTYLVMLPYGSDMNNSQSYQHALELINKFDFAYHIYDIQPAADALQVTNQDFLAKADATNVSFSLANIRPRVRMTYLYQLAQLGSRFVIGTGNMAEGTVGYFTKWGDGAVDLNPLAKLTKQEVYTLAKFLGVPDAIINKKPSAGLWEGQTDEDELGMSYAQIDSFILSGTSGDADIDEKIKQRFALSAHKFAAVPIFTE
ncbi:NAD(+) synthase [Sphingobacterium deserti]|uniref:NH(3)-dependent NAD(+) synthetase n=1 Tax=Sphingobacterium deserti TaxID=1229276 RepID=A0A0B8TCW1_9SPHI|nr:NAD(+) synthase [Sphingobacterium deserti]KGE16215.1 NAD+ synthetase [Sphingobacterium deserti]